MDATLSANIFSDGKLDGIFVCPDDNHQLMVEEQDFKCPACGRTFSILGQQIGEMVPSRPYPLHSDGTLERYNQAYQHLLSEPFCWDPSARAWGSQLTDHGGVRSLLEQERRIIEAHLGRPGVMADVSGGAGFFSLYFARVAGMVLHCDLACASLNQVYCMARGVKNLALVRCDYLQMPFKEGSLDAIICTGMTAGNGAAHDARLIKEIVRCLKPGGRFVIDLPNRMRVPRWLDILFPDWKSKQQAYDVADIESAFKDLDYQVTGCGYAPARMIRNTLAFKAFDVVFRASGISPARYIVLGEKSSSGSAK